MICFFAVLALYKLIKIYSESLAETSRIKMRPSLSAFCFLALKVSFSKSRVTTSQEFVFPWEKKTWSLKSSFHFCSTLLLEWVSSRDNIPVDHVFLLKYYINFNLFLYNCIPLKFLVIKLKLMFGNMRSLKLRQILNHKILTRNWTKNNICRNIIKIEMQ